MRAVIFVPPDVPLDGTYAEEAQAYVSKRGYADTIAPVLRSWDLIDRLLVGGWAQVVVVARHEHGRKGRPVEVTEAAEVAERADDTVPLGRVVFLRGPGRGGRHRAAISSLAGTVSPTGLTRRRTAAIIAGDEPIPPGIDPATVAAVRRIARRLNGLRPR